MSLDVDLVVDTYSVHTDSGIFVREDGATKEISREEWDSKFPGKEPVVFNQDALTNTVFSYNITHNLNEMAAVADLYELLWRPEELEITKAGQLISSLEEGLEVLKAKPDFFKTFNPANGWGKYENLVEFVKSYLEACKRYPNATIEVSR